MGIVTALHDQSCFVKAAITAGDMGATTQQVDVRAKPQAKEPSAARVIPALKVLRPKKLPLKKSTR